MVKINNENKLIVGKQTSVNKTKSSVKVYPTEIQCNRSCNQNNQINTEEKDFEKDLST